MSCIVIAARPLEATAFVVDGLQMSGGRVIGRVMSAVRALADAVALSSCAVPAGPIPGTASCQQEKSTFVEVAPEAKGYPTPEDAADAMVATVGSRPRTGEWQRQQDVETPTSVRLVAPPYLVSVLRLKGGTWVAGALSECVTPVSR